MKKHNTFINFNKDTTQVKTYLRNGKLVKAHKRRVDLVEKKKNSEKENRVITEVKNSPIRDSIEEEFLKKKRTQLIGANTGLGAVGLAGAASIALSRNKFLGSAALTSAILGIPTANFLILKDKYETNLKNSGKLLSSKEGRKEIDNMRLTKNSPIPKKTDKKQITFFFAGLSPSHESAEEAFNTVKKEFNRNGFNKNSELVLVTQENTNDGMGKAFKTVVADNLYNGRNSDSERIAKYIKDWKDKNPKAKLNLIGHSGGGLVSKDVGYILKESGIKGEDMKNLTIGTPYVNIYKPPIDTKNVILKDELTNFVPVKARGLEEFEEKAPLVEKGLNYHYKAHLYPAYFYPKIKQEDGTYKENPVYNKTIETIKNYFSL